MAHEHIENLRRFAFSVNRRIMEKHHRFFPGFLSILDRQLQPNRLSLDNLIIKRLSIFQNPASGAANRNLINHNAVIIEDFQRI